MSRLLTAVAALLFLLGGPADAADRAPRAEAYFAMGCFWCAESDMEKLPGVIEAISGYTGGKLADPSYEQVSAGGTGHFESVRVIYDPGRISYARLLDAFWHDVDPFDAKGQFCDKGEQYRAVIFVADEAQRTLAEASRAAVEKRFGKPVATLILPKTAFYPAEDYHQDYAHKNPIRYHFYRFSCGRDARLDAVWGD